MSFVSKMGRKTLLPLVEAARRARADSLAITQFVDAQGNYGYRVYDTSRKHGPSAMGDCEPGWSVRYQGQYKGRVFFPGRTLSEQQFISDPLKTP